MKRVMLAAALALAALSLAPRPAAASGDAPWCAMIEVGTDAVYDDCRYRTFEECRPHVLAGNRGFCNPNPAYVEPSAARPRAKKQRVRRD